MRTVLLDLSLLLSSLVTMMTAARLRLLRGAGGVWLAAPVAGHVAAPGAECPRCRHAAGAVSLLTIPVVYYACNHCAHRWSAATT